MPFVFYAKDYLNGAGLGENYPKVHLFVAFVLSLKLLPVFRVPFGVGSVSPSCRLWLRLLMALRFQSSVKADFR